MKQEKKGKQEKQWKPNTLKIKKNKIKINL